MEKTLLEIYISKAKFKAHVNKVVFLFDPRRRFIDDVVQDFCFYYANRPEKMPNIRKLYNLMITRLKHEKRYVSVDYDDFVKQVDIVFDDNSIDL